MILFKMATLLTLAQFNHFYQIIINCSRHFVEFSKFCTYFGFNCTSDADGCFANLKYTFEHHEIQLCHTKSL